MKTIGGESKKFDGDKITEAIVNTLFEKKFLATISWTGKGSKGVKNEPMSRYSRCIDLVSQLATAGGKLYTKDLCEKHIKYKILKYAYRVDRKNNKEHEKMKVICLDNLPMVLEDSTNQEVQVVDLIATQSNVSNSTDIPQSQTRPVPVPLNSNILSTNFPYSLGAGQVKYAARTQHAPLYVTYTRNKT